MIYTVIGTTNICSDCHQELRELWMENDDQTVIKVYFCGCVLTKEEADEFKSKISAGRTGSA